MLDTLFAILDLALGADDLADLSADLRHRHRRHQLIVLIFGLIIAVGGAIMVSRVIEPVVPSLIAAGLYLIFALTLLWLILKRLVMARRRR